MKPVSKLVILFLAATLLNACSNEYLDEMPIATAYKTGASGIVISSRWDFFDYPFACPVSKSTSFTIEDAPEWLVLESTTGQLLVDPSTSSQSTLNSIGIIRAKALKQDEAKKVGLYQEYMTIKAAGEVYRIPVYYVSDGDPRLSVESSVQYNFQSYQEMQLRIMNTGQGLLVWKIVSMPEWLTIKLPGKNKDNESLLLPIDSKFPTEDYQRMLEAYDNIGTLSPKELEAISKQFDNSVRKNAKDIRDKYINPPVTTDFAIMFVPTEGLYAEILRRTGLFETLQRDYKITVVGPTNLVAFLSSLQMGFKTLAIEKRSSEVWEILGAIKTEFGNFGIVLEKTKKKLQEAANVIDKAGIRSRAIERKLRTVQELPQEQTLALLGESIEIEEDNEQEEEEQ